MLQQPKIPLTNGEESCTLPEFLICRQQGLRDRLQRWYSQAEEDR